MKWSNLITVEEMAEIRKDPAAAAFLDARMRVANCPTDLEAQAALDRASESLASSLHEPNGSGLLCPPPQSKVRRGQKIALVLCAVIGGAYMAGPAFGFSVYHGNWTGKVDVLVCAFPALWTKWNRVSSSEVKLSAIFKHAGWYVWRWARLRRLEFLMLRCQLSVLLRFAFLRINICLQLLPKRVKFVAKFGLNWRLRKFDNEIVEFLQLERDVHKLTWRLCK